jgi:replication-associated recombination protein RarA
MHALTEQYRPRDWSEVVGQDKVLNQLAVIRKRHGTLGGRAYFLSGQSGTGKTTIARLIASEVADEWAVEEFDAAGLTSAKMDDIAKDLHYRVIGAKPGRAWIVNEVHGLTVVQVRKLLSLIEPAGGLPPWVVFAFTTTVEGQESLFEGCDDASPLLSRCTALALSRRDLAKPFAERARAIAQAEGLDGQPLERYVRLLQTHRNNLRAALQDIETGVMMAGKDGGA